MGKGANLYQSRDEGDHGRDARFDYLAPEDIDPKYGGGEAKRGPDPSYRINIIGCGVNGQMHIRHIQLEGRGAVRGLFDTQDRSVKTSLQWFDAPDSIQVFDSAEAACADPEAEAVLISTPNFTHREIFETAIEHDKHIYLEKPMATTVEDAWAMVQAARDYEKVAMVGLEYRQMAFVAEAAHEALERKTLGDVRMIYILEHRGPFLNKVRQWNKFSKYSGGTMVEKCCHYFDLFNWFAQSRPKRVYCSASMEMNFTNFVYEGEASDIVDNAFAIVDFENGVRASLSFCMYPQGAGSRQELVLAGTRGRLYAVDAPRQRIEIKCLGQIPDREMTLSFGGGVDAMGHQGSSYWIQKTFSDAVEGDSADYPTVWDGFWSVVVGVAAERSIASGQAVEIANLLDEAGCDL